MPRWLENKRSHPRFVWVCECISRSVVSESLQPCGLWPTRLLFHRILQARILAWAAIPFSRGSSWPRGWIWVSCIAGKFFTVWANREAQDLYNLKTCGPSYQTSWCHETLVSARSVQPGPMINQTSPTPRPLDPVSQLFGWLLTLDKLNHPLSLALSPGSRIFLEKSHNPYPLASSGPLI